MRQPPQRRQRLLLFDQPRVAATDADEILITLFGGKDRTRHDADFSVERFFIQLIIFHISRLQLALIVL